MNAKTKFGPSLIGRYALLLLLVLSMLTMILPGAICQDGPPSLGIRLSPSSATLDVGETQIFTATAMNGEEELITEGVMITFTSSNTAVGTVAPSSALTGPDGTASVTFTAIGAGVAVVDATNVSASEANVCKNGNATVAVTVPVVLRGDLNGDGDITTADALICLQITVGSREYDAAADMSDDGRVTSLDVLLILQAAAER